MDLDVPPHQSGHPYQRAMTRRDSRTLGTLLCTKNLLLGKTLTHPVPHCQFGAAGLHDRPPSNHHVSTARRGLRPLSQLSCTLCNHMANLETSASRPPSLVRQCWGCNPPGSVSSKVGGLHWCLRLPAFWPTLLGDGTPLPTLKKVLQEASVHQQRLGLTDVQDGHDLLPTKRSPTLSLPPTSPIVLLSMNPCSRQSTL